MKYCSIQNELNLELGHFRTFSGTNDLKGIKVAAVEKLASWKLATAYIFLQAIGAIQKLYADLVRV